MAIELGALLGSPGGGQSFENISSWQLPTAACSLFTQTTDVHSSPTGGWLKVYSGASGSLKYSYGVPADAYLTWSPDVTTHALTALGWARVDAAAYSGQVTAVFTGGVSYPIPFAATLQPFRLDIPNAQSGQALSLDFALAAGLTGSFGLFLDDILMAADVVQLWPDFSTEQKRQMNRAGIWTVGGREASYLWSQRPSFGLPLPIMIGSLADLLNTWFGSANTLYFSLNTSDTAARWVTRIGGLASPAQGFRPPYQSVQPAQLQLEAVDGSLVW